jgi:hypothetical protein
MPNSLSREDDDNILAILQALRDLSRSLLDQIESTTDRHCQLELNDQIAKAGWLSSALLSLQLTNDDAVLSGQLPHLKAEATSLKDEALRLKDVISDAAAFANMLGFATQIAGLIAAL